MALQEAPPSAPTIELMSQVNPIVWEIDKPGRAVKAIPIKVTQREGEQPVQIRRRPLTMEELEGLEPVISRLLKYGLLIEGRSPYNSPIMAVKKPTGQ